MNVPKVLFYPERRKNELGVLRVKNVPLLLFFSFKGRRLQYYSGERIDLKDWDFESRLVLPSHPEHASINERLDFLKRKLLETYRNMEVSGQSMDIPNLRKKLKENLKKGKASFFSLLILFIEEKNSEWTLSTYRKIKTLYNHLRNFLTKTGIEPDFSSMDDVFFLKLTDYFRNDCHHIDSTIRKNLEVFMWFMNWALKKKYHNNHDFKNSIDKYLKLNSTSKESLFLSMSEIQAISQYAAMGRKETFARDVFVFACLTGLTCTELRLLRPLNIEDDWIIVSSGSRGRKVPILPQARLLLDSYLKTANITLFPKIYPHKINRFLKEIARKSNLTREIRVIKYKNNEEMDVSAQAYKLLTLSIARKTFIELALNKGIDPIIVSNAAGYKSMNTVSLRVKIMDMRKLEEFKKFRVEEISNV